MESRGNVPAIRAVYAALHHAQNQEGRWLLLTEVQTGLERDGEEASTESGGEERPALVEGEPRLRCGAPGCSTSGARRRGKWCRG
jgi:hypothetical protein